MGVKQCSKCGEIKPLGEFYRRRAASDGRYAYCKPCSHKTNQEWKVNNRDRANEHERRWRATDTGRRSHTASTVRHRRGRLGLPQAEFDALLVAQEGRCAICRRRFEEITTLKTAPCVDHCHFSGRVRGLLCTKCNTGIGMFEDNPEFLAQAIEYLRAA